MLRLASFSVFIALALTLQGRAQLQNTGIPASVSSPTADGRQHGIPASVVSPKPPIPGVNRPNRSVIASRRRVRPFGDSERHRRVLVPVPLFYPAYGQTYDAESAVADPADPGATDSTDAVPADDNSAVAQNEDALRKAYLQGARDALVRQEDRYGKHRLDSRDSAPKTLAQNRPDPSPAAEPVVDDSPTTVFIFKDGHQIESRNFAIMGQTLYDFSDTGLKKVQLSELDTAATQKANDDRGTAVKLP
jgi:hypothetical protein